MPLWPDAIRRLRVPGSGHSGEGRISWRAGQRRVAGKIGTLTIIDRDANFNDLIDDPGAPGVATYSYDPASPRGLRGAGGQNRRIRKVVENGESGITYDYYYNESWQVLEVRKGGDTDPLEQYVWGVQYVDAPVVRFRDGNVDGDLLDTQDNTDSTLYYTYDGNFNVTAVIKPDGTVAERYTYDPYGKVTFKAADWSAAASQAKSAYDNEVLYCGYRFDPESGLYHVRRRYLTPPLGRWLTPDPIGYGDGMNWYQYVGSSPGVHTDPTGQATLTVNVLPGWYTQKLPQGILGQARWCFRINAACACPPKRTKWNMPNIVLQVQLVITLNTSPPLTPGNKEGVYGHELRHVTMMETVLNQHRQDLVAKLKADESKTFDSEDKCESYRMIDLRNKYKEEIKTLASGTPEHEGPEQGFWDVKDRNKVYEEEMGHPYDGQEYPNHPGNLAGDSKGDGVPAKDEDGWVCNEVNGSPGSVPKNVTQFPFGD